MLSIGALALTILRPQGIGAMRREDAIWGERPQLSGCNLTLRFLGNSEMARSHLSPALALAGALAATTLSACSQQDDHGALGFQLGMDKHSAYANICTGNASRYVKWVEFHSAAMEDRHGLRDHDYSAPTPACSPYGQFSKYASWDVFTNDKYHPLPVRSFEYHAKYRIELDFKGDKLVRLTWGGGV